MTRLERKLIGRILLINSLLEDLNSHFIFADDLPSEEGRMILNAMVNIYKRNQTINLVSVTDELRKKDLIVKIGGLDVLLSCLDPELIYPPFPSNVLQM